MPAENTQDVVAAVQLARARSLAITVRSGGHGWSASHLRDDVLLIDVSRLEEISIDSSGARAWVGPGAKGWHLNRELRARGRMFPAGHHRSVGLGGYLLNGGWGWNARQFGVACSNVTWAASIAWRCMRSARNWQRGNAVDDQPYPGSTDCGAAVDCL